MTSAKRCLLLDVIPFRITQKSFEFGCVLTPTPTTVKTSYNCTTATPFLLCDDAAAKQKPSVYDRANKLGKVDGQVARGGGLDDHGEQGKASWMGKGRKRLAGNLNSPCTCLASLSLYISFLPGYSAESC